MKAPSWLKRLRINRVALVDKGANPEAEIVLFKREHGFASMEECMAEHDDMDKCKALMGEMEKMTDKTPDPTAIEKRLAEFEKRAAEAEAKAKAADEKVQKLEDQREMDVFIAKASGLKDAGFTPDDAAILRKVYKAVTAEEAKRLDAILNGAAALARDSVAWREVGVAGAGGFGGGAYEKLEKMAKEVQAKEPKLTAAQAMTKAADTPEGLALYNEYEKERSEAVRRVR